MTDNIHPALSLQIISFLREIGIEVEAAQLPADTFLPGIFIAHGRLLVDETKLAYPGDLLHEAGHLAVAEASKRKQLYGNAGQDVAEELMAIAWSYAALVHLKLEPSVVFHADGYKGGSDSLIENFTQGYYFGVPTLQWIGLTADDKRAGELGIEPYPHMIKWLRD